MRRLLVIALVGAGLWGGYWFVGAGAAERAMAAWFEARRGAGGVAGYSSLNTAGFPNRFDTTILDLELGDGQGTIWRAPMVQMLALSYRPNHIIAVLPPTQSLTTRVGPVAIVSARMRGSVLFQPGTALTLEHATIVAEGLDLSGQGWSAKLAEGRLASRRTAARALSHDIALEALGFTPPVGLRRRLDPGGGLLPETLERVLIDTTLGFDAPLDRHALDGPGPGITAIEINALDLNWGRLALAASGSLVVNELGQPEGRITITATHWRDMLGLAVAAGLVRAEIAPTVERGLEIIAGMSGGADTLKAPLSFQNGFVSFGPIPLGPAPRLR